MIASVFVVGAGNVLLGDEGVGVHAVRAFASVCPAGAEAIEAGTAAFAVEASLRDASLVILLDAIRGGGPPGSVYTYAYRADGQRPALRSLHDVTVPDLVARLDRHAPPLIVIGVEPDWIGPTLELSSSVRRAMPRAVEWALDLVRWWQRAVARGERPTAAAAVDWLDEMTAAVV